MIAVATIGIMRFVGQSVASKFTSIGYALQGENKKPAIENVDENLLKRKDMGDFMNGVGSRGGNGQ